MQRNEERKGERKDRRRSGRRGGEREECPGFFPFPAPTRASYWLDPLAKASGKCSLQVKGGKQQRASRQRREIRVTYLCSSSRDGCFSVPCTSCFSVFVSDNLTLSSWNLGLLFLSAPSLCPCISLSLSSCASHSFCSSVSSFPSFLLLLFLLSLFLCLSPLSPPLPLPAPVCR